MWVSTQRGSERMQQGEMGGKPALTPGPPHSFGPTVCWTLIGSLLSPGALSRG